MNFLVIPPHSESLNIEKSPWAIIKEVEELAEMTWSSVKRILTEDVRMKMVTKFVPQLLNKNKAAWKHAVL